MAEDKNARTGLWLGGLPWWQAVICILLCLIPMYLTVQGKDGPKMVQSTTMAGTLAICFGLAVIFNEIGERVPIWNTYIGGGLLATFFGVAVLKQFNLVPEAGLDAINSFISDDANFLEMFIIMLIIGSVLSLDRDILLRSFAGYIPAILGGLLAATILGGITGAIFGIPFSDTLIKYTLPIMGGGNGAGAVPLSQIYEQVTGDAAANYYSFAIIVLTIANIFCIIASAALNALGEKVPSLTGDKKTLIRGAEELARDDEKIKTDNTDLSGALLLAFACFSVGILMSSVILPKIAGAPIHKYAYMIIFVVILAATGLVPARVRAGAKRLQSFFSGQLGIIIMVGMGADFNLGELFKAVAPSNIIMALMIVIGAIIGSAAVGYLVGFYPIDSAITAGLCMANRGGNGDLACLGAADRMDLIAYSQLSSRLGGGIVLIIASFVFSFML
ncbi:2-hydroxycarboxylate transporter family protein [Oribacterium sp. HCP28S3_H8]|uniref:2-hydroxycarboxylate transporter family protein n=1 Tax=Oribacterium sp. HCP28S3_H8 TaxID=3438945 RepID=UPI003F8B841A